MLAYISSLENFITQSNGDAYFSARFWAIEHTILMFFAIIFGHLGLVYASNLKDSNQIFKKNLCILVCLLCLFLFLYQ